MRVFNFSWHDYREAYERDGWAHIKGGVDSEFFDVARAFIQEQVGAQRLSGQGISGQKEQFLFDFPETIDYGRDLFDVLAPLTGLSRPRMTLSERHVKAYEEGADPLPVAHKDRLSSQISVGLSVEVPRGSYLVLYPNEDRQVNPFLSTGLRDSLEPDRLPEVILEGAAGVEIYDSPGDVIVFPGASMWHLRRHSAGTVNIYLKFNDFDADPLGEDPSTEGRRTATLAALQGDQQELGTFVPVLSRRFDSVIRSHSRNQWRESVSAIVWGRAAVPLSETDYNLLRALGDGRPWTSVASSVQGVALGTANSALRRLAERGVVDLLPAEQDAQVVAA